MHNVFLKSIELDLTEMLIFLLVPPNLLLDLELVLVLSTNATKHQIIGHAKLLWAKVTKELQLVGYIKMTLNSK